MERSSLPCIFAYLPLIAFKLLLAYLRYRRTSKKYVKKFRKTLIKNGIPAKEAKELADMVNIIGVRDFIRVISEEKGALFR